MAPLTHSEDVSLAVLNAKLDSVLEGQAAFKKLYESLDARIGDIEVWAGVSKDRWNEHGKLHTLFYGLYTVIFIALVYLIVNLSVHMGVVIPFK